MAALGVMKDLLKRTARGRSTASVTAGEARGRPSGGIEGEERPVPQGGADDAVPVPASRAVEGAHGGEGKPSRAPHPGHERDILHQGQVGDSADARVDLTPYEYALVDAGQGEAAQ